VPDLTSTLQKYLSSVEHLIPEEQYGVTKALVADFGRPGGEGEFLQEKLREVAEMRDNWVGLPAWWSPVVMFGGQQPGVINNTFIVFSFVSSCYYLLLGIILMPLKTSFSNHVK
jgi:hypothetical protein